MGLEDPVATVEVLKAVRELRPQAPVHELPGLGHYPQVEDPPLAGRGDHTAPRRLGDVGPDEPGASDFPGVRPSFVLSRTYVCDNIRAVVNAIATENGAVGERVKALRRSMGLSLRELAERSGVSAPMLSQVERGETSPSLTVAGRIASGLELTLSQLLRLDEAEHVVVVPKGSGRARERGGHRTEELTPALPGQRADVSRHTLEPGASTGGPSDPPMHEAGARETALVLDGTLTLVVDGEDHTLSAGDAVTFDADLPHHFENRDTLACEFVAVVAAGLRRS